MSRDTVRALEMNRALRLHTESSSPLHAGEDRDEQLLVSRVRDGDPLAFELIFRCHYASMVDVAQRVLRTRYLAEDVVQDVFAAIWSSRRNWHLRSSLQSYLQRAARNMALRYATRPAESRAESLTGRNPDDRTPTDFALLDPRPSPDEVLLGAEMAAEVTRVVAAMPPRVRETYELSRNTGLSNRRIAEQLGISVKTVELHMTRALSTLREELRRWNGG